MSFERMIGSLKAGAKKIERGAQDIGVRFYGREEVLRVQQLELGDALSKIAEAGNQLEEVSKEDRDKAREPLP